MEFNKHLAIIWLTICLLLSSQAIYANTQTAPQLNIELFTKKASVRQVEISPDGKHIAAVFVQNGEDLIGVLRLSDMKPVLSMAAYGKANKVNEIAWANNERIIYSTFYSSNWEKEKFSRGEIFAVNIDGSKSRPVVGYRTKQKSRREKGKYGDNLLIDMLPDDKKHILIAFYPWRQDTRYYYRDPEAKPIIYKANIYTSRLTKIAELPSFAAQALTDHKHRVRLSIGDTNEGKQVIHYRKNDQDDWQLHSFEGLKDAVHINPLIFAEDNNNLYILASMNQGPDTLYLYDLSTDKAKKIYQHQNADIDQFVYNANQDKIVALSVEAGYPEYYLLDKEDRTAKIFKQMLGKYPGYKFNLASLSHNAKRAIIEISSGFQPSLYHLYDHKSKQSKYLLSQKQWLSSKHMANREPVSYKARDGLALHGFLTRPLGKSKSLPTVILPHGGPHGIKDSWGFDWQAQLLANRGYAVLQLNYRGSYGYGYEFEKAGYGQWGQAMQDDLTDATKALIEQGIADKNRICIYGASYGGYAALMGVIREPDLYQCAIGTMGVYSLPMMFKEGDIADRVSGINYLKKVLGESTEQQKAYSPAYNTDKIKVPLLLIHGKKDHRAPIEQFDALEAALKANNKTYQKLILADEGHGFYNEQTRIQVYSQILKFLDKHIGK